MHMFIMRFWTQFAWELQSYLNVNTKEDGLFNIIRVFVVTDEQYNTGRRFLFWDADYGLTPKFKEIFPCGNCDDWHTYSEFECSHGVDEATYWGVDEDPEEEAYDLLHNPFNK